MQPKFSDCSLFHETSRKYLENGAKISQAIDYPFHTYKLTSGNFESVISPTEISLNENM